MQTPVPFRAVLVKSPKARPLHPKELMPLGGLMIGVTISAVMWALIIKAVWLFVG